jgi:hypothetical protein
MLVRPPLRNGERVKSAAERQRVSENCTSEFDDIIE